MQKPSCRRGRHCPPSAARRGRHVDHPHPDQPLPQPAPRSASRGSVARGAHCCPRPIAARRRPRRGRARPGRRPPGSAVATVGPTCPPRVDHLRRVHARTGRAHPRHQRERRQGAGTPSPPRSGGPAAGMGVTPVPDNTGPSGPPSGNGGRLPCGVLVEDLLSQVADAAPPADPGHQRGCPHCRATLAQLDDLWSPVRQVTAETVQAPPGLLQAVMTQVGSCPGTAGRPCCSTRRAAPASPRGSWAPWPGWPPSRYRASRSPWEAGGSPRRPTRRPTAPGSRNREVDRPRTSECPDPRRGGRANRRRLRRLHAPRRRAGARANRAAHPVQTGLTATEVHVVVVDVRVPARRPGR